jgi:hypothetical protein
MKTNIEGAEIDLLDCLLSSGFDNICQTNKLMVERHAHIFETGSDKQL